MLYAKLYGNHELNLLPTQARYLYTGLLAHADDDGKMNGDERYVKGLIFAYDEDITAEHVLNYLQLLHQNKLIILYENSADKRPYIKHPKWAEYQKIRGDMYKKSTIPEPDTACQANWQKQAYTKPSVHIRNETVTKAVHKLSKVKLSKYIVADGDDVNSTKKEAEKPFVFSEKLLALKDSVRKDLKIIALYWKRKGFRFENEEQYQAALKRELIPAKMLRGYTGVQISEAITFCQKKFEGDMWTLETVHKRITHLQAKPEDNGQTN